jgi:hypothetical protein
LLLFVAAICSPEQAAANNTFTLSAGSSTVPLLANGCFTGFFYQYFSSLYKSSVKQISHEKSAN